MNTKRRTSKSLSNPSSTGGLGVHFEGHVQASFVTLMLTGGHGPCLPHWPITEVKLQGKIDGFDTDDFIAVARGPGNSGERRLLGQIKHSIRLTAGSAVFGEVLQAAWNDFRNSAVFTPGKDVIALITGPLNRTDLEASWVLNHARANPNDPSRFFRNVATANFSSADKKKKLEAFRHHLNVANEGVALTDEELHRFLRHFYILGYDLGEEEGVVLSLISSHISQFRPDSSRLVWSRILEFTNNRNHHAGHIRREDCPEDLTDIFVTEPVREIPKEFVRVHVAGTNWPDDADANYLSLAVLVGSWNENHPRDLQVISELLGISYEIWLEKARNILHRPDSPLSLKDGIWRVADRADLWRTLGSRIFDQNLDTFRALAVRALREKEPSFELAPDERYAAAAYGKVPEHSTVLRSGLADGLAIVASHSDQCTNCSHGKAAATVATALREIFADADWVLWGSLDRLLPSLAESGPDKFLEVVNTELQKDPCAFDELFAQEGSGSFGTNYLTGLLWALEGLAWEERYLVRVCVTLGELAAHDPGGRWVNRPSNSLATVLLPWLPQTMASFEKRKVAIETLFNERPEVAWRLVLDLLPGQHQSSSGSHRPSWRKQIPAELPAVTNSQYREQVAFLAERAVEAAGEDFERILGLIDELDSLPQPAFGRFLETLASGRVATLPESQRMLLWDRLTRFATKHRRFVDAAWALSDDLVAQIENVADQLAPTDAFNRHQRLFNNRDFDLAEESGNWEHQRNKLDQQREAAVSEIYTRGGAKRVLAFAAQVSSPGLVGIALAAIEDASLDCSILPPLLDTSDPVLKAVAGGYVWKRHRLAGWDWCDEINRSGWTPAQLGQYLAYLPFTKRTWDRAAAWLKKREGEYWSRAATNAIEAGSDASYAIDRLIEHGKPHAAISCLAMMRHLGHQIGPEQCVKALLAALSSAEKERAIDSYDVIELIKLLQSDPTLSSDDLFKVEWAYLPLLNHLHGAAPQLLESRLASDPGFFSEMLRLIYRPINSKQPEKEHGEREKQLASNAWQLLRNWKTPPGMQSDRTFIAAEFSGWLSGVREICTKSGHLEVALSTVGGVLIHVPADPNGLWIHSTVAKVLNAREHSEMRNGFSIGVYNSRGAHWVDPEGKPEMELAAQYRRKAEDVENAGFQRFAATLNSIADSYQRDAEQNIRRARDRNET